MRATRLLLVLTMLGAATPRAARAEPPADARVVDDLKRKGDEAMIGMRYADAADAYKRAYEMTRSPALLYNMGRAYEGLGEFPKALASLEEFAHKAPPDLKARVPKLDQLLSDLRSRVSTLVLSCSVEGADIKLGDRVIGKTQSGQATFKVNAGAAHLVITHEGYFTFERNLSLAGSRVENVNVELASLEQTALLRIMSPVSGAAVSVDGTAIGVVPAETAANPGSHSILLRRDGYDPAETTVVLSAGEKKEVTVPMAAHETIASKWWFWTTIGVAVVAGGVATYIVATQERSADAGTIPPGQVKAQLRF